MFTGIVRTIGTLAEIIARDDGMSVTIAGDLISPVKVRVGDSVAVSGVCLTAVAVEEGAFSADISLETLSCTRFGELERGARVNLEFSLALGDSLDGHLVAGHVDGLARCVSAEPRGSSRKLVFEVGREIGGFIAKKGSVAIDGVSLTCNEVTDEGTSTRFSANVIAHTLGETTLSDLKPGDSAHLEVDLMARYVIRNAQAHSQRGT